MIDLGVSEAKQIYYKTPLPSFEDKLITLYKCAISMLQNVPTLEREIMENLIWTHTPMLAWYNSHMEENVLSLQKRTTEAMYNAIVPLNKYLETYQPYQEFIELEIDEYIANLKSKKVTLEEFENEIQFHLKKQEEIEIT